MNQLYKKCLPAFQLLKKIYIKLKIIIHILFILLLLIIFYYIRYPAAIFISKTLIIQDKQEKAEVILVHAGDSIRRLQKMYKVYKQQDTIKIWLTATTPGKTATNFYKIFNILPREANLYIAAFRNVSISTSQYKIFEGTLSTYDDCRFFYKAYKKNPFKKAIVISDPIHSYRIKMCLNHLFPDDVKFIFTLNDEKLFRISHIDPDDYVSKVFNELIKVWVYQYRLWTIWKNTE